MEDAVSCAEKSLLRAALVMVGLAAEETLRTTHSAMVNLAYITKSAPATKNAKDILEEIQKAVASWPNANDEQHRLTKAIAAAESIRTERNKASHPGVLAPDGVHALQLLDPAPHDVRGVPTQALREVEEPRSRLHVAMFVHDDHREHAAALGVLLLGDLPQHRRQRERVRGELDGLHSANKIAVGDHAPELRAGREDRLHLRLRRSPILIREAVPHAREASTRSLAAGGGMTHGQAKTASSNARISCQVSRVVPSGL
jgi:gas vesicle protein